MKMWRLCVGDIITSWESQSQSQSLSFSVRTPMFTSPLSHSPTRALHILISLFFCSCQLCVIYYFLIKLCLTDSDNNPVKNLISEFLWQFFETLLWSVTETFVWATIITTVCFHQQVRQLEFKNILTLSIGVKCYRFSDSYPFSHINHYESLFLCK